MKTALVLGGSRGIGAECVREMRRRGWRAGFTYFRSEEEARALAHETGAACFPCDARKEEDIAALSSAYLNMFSHLDALIYSAGSAYAGLLQDMKTEDFDDLYALHVRGAFLAVRAFLPGMIERKGGSILLISSMWGQVGASCEAAYSGFKAAQLGLMKALAKELGPSGIRVNCIAPGVIETDMLKGYSESDLNALREETPLMRLGAPWDVARAAAFLCGEEAAFITGQTLGVNGGFVIT